MNYTVCDNELKVCDFLRLFSSVGWGELDEDMAKTALENSWATFHVEYKGKVIAMGRLLGDGAMSFFLKDFVVLPEFQGQGIGRLLLNHIEMYIAIQLKPGWSGYLQLVSSKDKDAFYSKMGYRYHPNQQSGPGMSKWIDAR